jgi:D-serine deaminase-like pyridoxal phosphate-dependent protein
MADALRDRVIENLLDQVAQCKSEGIASTPTQTGVGIEALRTPCYVLDIDIATKNAATMLDRARSLGCKLRPHVKTHKTLQGATLQTGGTKRGIVCSTLAEVQFFTSGGFDDIIYAVPITPDKLEEAAELTKKLTNFHIIVDNKVQVDAIMKYGKPCDKPWSIYMMVDCGYHRDGVDPDAEASVDLAVKIHSNPDTTLAGLYTHGGHSYGEVTPESIKKVGSAERDAVVGLAQKIRDACKDTGLLLSVGVGSTPTCSIPPDHLEGVDEMHPGTDTIQSARIYCTVYTPFTVYAYTVHPLSHRSLLSPSSPPPLTSSPPPSLPLSTQATISAMIACNRVLACAKRARSRRGYSRA